ncbi:hypothetical protein LAZ67_10004176 [Cordylochernes scorpioides]|uniref:RNA-directed DNA polymerase n=1 Tax=Cordylochernes scorpioides TaxID=51811 RepID=A0ABY6KXI2_9ARAC|nr:hypothetical protein LAZ67_10004176 [Cordylochernes scorpioides]
MLKLPLKRLRFNQSSPFKSNNKKPRNDIITERSSRQDKEMELNQDPIGVKSDGPTETMERRQEVRESEPTGERQEVTGRETTAPLADAVNQLSTLLTRVKISDGAESAIPPFDGTYNATQFFQAFDRKMEDASIGEQEKLLRLPNYLVRQPLELFRKLRLADRSYFQVRQILLDLYPESSEASFAKYFAMKLTGQANLETYYREKTAMGLQLGLPQEVILETLTEGLQFNDQRLVRVVPPENLGEWFRLVQRIHGPSAPTTRPREDQPPTMSAFATFEGLYQPTRLPFGLKTSPQIYERAISQVLQRHGLDCVAHYFDDFIIYSNTLEEHQNHLRQFFAFCEAEKLQLNFAKCEFFKQSINFLGYTITAGTITPLTRNTDIIHAIKQPHNRKTLQSFLGAVNVYNKFIPEYARLRAPLNNLLKKDVVWNWNEACQEAFIDLKGNLTQHPILHLYKEGLPCQVYCDASTLGIAGILKQVHPDGNIYPVQYFSRTLRPHEKNYSISELECLAIVESVEKFRIYLMGRKFTIFSDHHALQWLKTIKNPSGRLFRWSLRLSSYEYEVRYIKGKLQYEADLLSRNPFCGFLDATLIKTHQPPPSKESSLTIDRNGLHTVSRKGITKIILPKPLIQQLLQTVHTQYNHPGISQMSRIISTQYYWQGMSKDIKQKVKTCPTCQLTKRPVGPTYGELSQPPESKEPFDLLSLDTIAGFAKYGNTKIYLHVVVDHFSRYAWAFPSKSTSTTTYQQVLKRVSQDGSPKRLLTDRAPAFTSPKFRSFLLNRNIHPLLTTSNNPQANGLCERLNATLTGKLRLLHLENPKIAWTKLVKKIVKIPLDPVWISWNKVRPRLTRAISPKPWSLGGRFSVCQSWCCGFVTDPRPLVAATVNRWRQFLTFILTGEAPIASIYRYIFDTVCAISVFFFEHIFKINHHISLDLDAPIIMPRKRSAIGIRTPAARRITARDARGQSSRTLETPQQSQARLLSDRLRHRVQRATESPQHSELQLQAQRDRRALKTPQQSQTRQVANRLRHFRQRASTWADMQNAAFHYTPSLNYEQITFLQIGHMGKQCSHCTALKYNGERPGMCCSAGKVRIPDLLEPPKALRTLLDGSSPHSAEFIQCVRHYKNAFQMTSFGCGSRVVLPGYMPTFKVQGQVYHRIGSVLPPLDSDSRELQPAFLQVFFMGDSSAELVQ